MTDEHWLARATGPGDELAPPADEVAFQAALLRLIERRAGIYTMGDSTSLPADVAAELLRSICFVLGIDPDERVVPEYLLRVDLEREFRRRLADIERKVGAAERLWSDVCVAMPPIPNIALRDTLSGIRDFFKRYDFRSMAHDIPCSIDYPLCHPVETSILGVEYIAEYLRRLMLEARFLRLFEIAACAHVLGSASADYIELLVNLYEPVALNAIGLALIGEEPARLVIGDEERQAIAARLGPLAHTARERVLHEAASAACEALGIFDEDERQYLAAVVHDLLPRTEIGLAHGSLRGVFVG